MKPFKPEPQKLHGLWLRCPPLRGSLLVLPVFLACCGQPQQQASTTAAGDSIEGVWEVMTQMGADGKTTDPAGPGQLIFMSGRYSVIYSIAAGERPSSAAPFNPTPDEKAAQYDTIIANSGTYEISGSQLTLRPLIAKTPEFSGGSSTNMFRVDGDTLVMTTQSVVARDGANLPNPGASMTLRRVP